MMAQCEHGKSDWAIVVSTGTNTFHGRGCQECARKVANYWFQKPWVAEVVVLPTEQYEAVLRGLEVAGA